VSERAGFWARFGASLIDGLVLGVVSVILRLILGTGLGTLITLVISAGYFTYFHGTSGQTPGDAALSLRVVDAGDDPIGYARAFGRWVVSYISAVVILLGFLWMIWDPEKQTWHDKAVGSFVVKT
jgi:uncharacterized RDD family membrane protein YckC